jgi:nucleoside-diphosphate-sugar epimerase
MSEKQLKKILITGKDSYIGISFEKWLQQWPDQYLVNTIDMMGDEWRKTSFMGYDVVFHVAGIAHVSADPKMEALYYKVNRDLAIETAQKAKNDDVRQFVFMSSIIVYGENTTIGQNKIITKATVPCPANCYGDSKLQAECGIKQFADENFRVVILRPPMIYGKGSKGNYPILAKYAIKLPLFPEVINQRSMLYVGNFTEFVRLMIDNEESGTFFPQNVEYVCTSHMVKAIANVHGHKIWMTKVFNQILKLLCKKMSIVNKVFGNQGYDMSMSEYMVNYRLFDFADSIKRAEVE